ncbi:hypothetical protein EUX98_g8405 [Antrodiella citrinella]|uniref:Uncharacterized protein n=1 Tax=Antrodiella citrinella TaxID=2447956 RepID=A0A4S4M9C8_9APHY|nr:hypothetical protein EUX98_g8405 [Antrodiella citrinella]
MGLRCPVRFWQDAMMTSSEELGYFRAVLQDIRPSHLFAHAALGAMTKNPHSVI